jgi:hypothetical protein
MTDEGQGATTEVFDALQRHDVKKVVLCNDAASGLQRKLGNAHPTSQDREGEARRESTRLLRG